MKKILLLLLMSPVFAKAQIITTVVGTGVLGYSGDNGPATAAKLHDGAGVVFDTSGNLYVSSGGRIRKINTLGIITTIAGTGSSGYSGDGGPATSAMMSQGGIDIDASGNIYLADETNYAIRKISASGIITTIAGTGVLGFSGEGVPATSSMINPIWVKVDRLGKIYFDNNQCVCTITSSGTVHIIAGTGTPGFSGDGGPATTAMLHGNEDIAIDSSGNILIADEANERIRRIDVATQIITTIAGTGTYGYSGDLGPATAAELGSPFGLTIGNNNEIYFSDYDNNVIRKISSSGIISTVAGNDTAGYCCDGGPATAAKLFGPYGVTLDICGNLYIFDGHNNRVRKVTFDTSCGNEQGDGTLLLNSISEASSKIYPNPATTSLTITSGESIKTITITNLLGQPIYTHEYNTNNAEVDVSTLPTGIYLIRINGTEVRKFVKE